MQSRFCPDCREQVGELALCPLCDSQTVDTETLYEYQSDISATEIDQYLNGGL